jgi:hypothetical protein
MWPFNWIRNWKENEELAVEQDKVARKELSDRRLAKEKADKLASLKYNWELIMDNIVNMDVVQTEAIFHGRTVLVRWVKDRVSSSYPHRHEGKDKVFAGLIHEKDNPAKPTELNVAMLENITLVKHWRTTEVREGQSTTIFDVPVERFDQDVATKMAYQLPRHFQFKRPDEGIHAVTVTINEVDVKLYVKQINKKMHVDRMENMALVSADGTTAHCYRWCDFLWAEVRVEPWVLDNTIAPVIVNMETGEPALDRTWFSLIRDEKPVENGAIVFLRPNPTDPKTYLRRSYRLVLSPARYFEAGSVIEVSRFLDRFRDELIRYGEVADKVKVNFHVDKIEVCDVDWKPHTTDEPFDVKMAVEGVDLHWMSDAIKKETLLHSTANKSHGEHRQYDYMYYTNVLSEMDAEFKSWNTEPKY